MVSPRLPLMVLTARFQRGRCSCTPATAFSISKRRSVKSSDRKSAWDLMNQQSIVTLPITRSKRLEGLITVSDITGMV